MEEKNPLQDQHLVFAINGERFEVPSIHPSTTVIEFLRTRTRFKSVKLACAEGGCGSCTVMVSKYNIHHNKVENYTINSCLTLLCSLNGCSITTSEGIGNSRNGFHPIQKAFAGFHASQCGFCTPGMCMSLFSAVTNSEKLTVSEAEKSIAGNLCRCTGYRPIADACKSFAYNVDIEDLGLNSFWRKEDSKEDKVSKLPCIEPNEQVCRFPEFLKVEVELNSKGCSWYSPTSINQLQSSLGVNECNGNNRVKLVASNTGSGYYKEVEKYDIYIDLSKIPELSVVQKDEDGVHIGAAVTISRVIETLKDCNDFILSKIANHLEKVATKSVRNSASIGGNLVMAQRNGFPSDIATLLLDVDSTVELMVGLQRKVVTVEDFLARPPFDSRDLLVSVNIPSWKPASGRNSKLLFETYRASPQPLGNALPSLNAAFLAEVSPNKDFDCVVINSINLAFGAYGNVHAVRAKTVEDFLVGKNLKYDVLYEAAKLVKAFIVPEGSILNVSYKSSLAAGFLFEFLHPLIGSCREVYGVPSNGYHEPQSTLDCVNRQFDQINVNEESPILLPANQIIGSSGKFRPVGDSIIKTGAVLQASGEAVYVDDIPSPENCLYGAFIYSTMPRAIIKGIKFKSASYPDGVIAIISYKDIPSGGKNIGSKTIFNTEPLFAENITNCAGDRIALVVAETQKQADLAANLVVIDYETDGLEPPILTLEEAVEKSSFFEVPAIVSPKQVGDFAKGMDEAEHKILKAEISLPSQYYFYMETQTALAVPDEDNCMVVYSSNQCPEYCHSVIASCIGVPEHNIRVITRRVGGGFGGKAIRAMPVATVCALAANKLQRPVRIYVNRKTDMIMTGGRHPMKVTYTVGFNSNGKITGLHLDVLINAGIVEDISPMLPMNIVSALKKYDWGALSFDMKVCKTNHTSKSAMRGPGEVQGSYIAEAVIEHVAAKLLMEVDSVRARNLHSFTSLRFFYENSAGEPDEYTLPGIWDKLAESARFSDRKQTIKEFNTTNLWRKRGVSRLPIVHQVMVRPTPGRVSILWDGSVVVEVGGIELGQGLWTKVKQMAAFSLGLIQCEGVEEVLDKVRVVQSDTLSLVQGGFTSGSTTSESSCEAVRICCDVLVERLKPLKENMQKQTGSVDWKALILQAEFQSVNLSASSYYVPEATSMQYLNYGAAISEVEVNLITGETAILRSDIIYDCGQSLNPAVDLGQIEGAFVQGIGFFMIEEYLTDSNGMTVSDSTWNYKIPTLDTIPKQLNVEILNSGHHQKRVLSSKASGEPPLLLAASVHCATRAAIKEARRQLRSWGGMKESDSDSIFQLSVPATMAVVKELCGLDIVEKYLEYKMACGK